MRNQPPFGEMIGIGMRQLTLSLLALSALSAVWPHSLAATEIAATHLVFEKSAKLKKVDATLYLPFVDESQRLLCGVQARGKSGRLNAAGTFRLRLVGERSGGSEAWESDRVSAPANGFGEGGFEAAELADLAAAARADGADSLFLRVDFAGGRGGRIEELTLDCLRERSGG